jgi:hypothetical protein
MVRTARPGPARSLAVTARATHMWRAVLGVTALAVAATACGGDDGTAEPPAGSSATTVSAPAGSPPAEFDGPTSTAVESPAATDPADGPGSTEPGSAEPGSSSSAPAETSPDDGDAADAGAPGTATVEVDGDRFEFVVIQCLRDQPSPLTGDVIESMPTAVIVDAVRTAGGKRNGSSPAGTPPTSPPRCLKALAERNDLDPALVDDVIMGCVMQVGDQGLNVGRNAVLAAGWPESVPATTVDRQCGSSQQSAHFAAQGVMAGAYDIVVAAGVEVMTHPDGRLDHPRLGFPFGPEGRGRYADVGRPRPPGHLGRDHRRQVGPQSREDLDAFGARASSAPPAPRRGGASTTRSSRSPRSARQGDRRGRDRRDGHRRRGHPRPAPPSRRSPT